MRLHHIATVLSLSYICSLSSCTDEMPAMSPEEQYTRDFVQEFGVFKAESWSEARSAAITVVTDYPTPVNVFAEIDGQRFLFASLSGVNGTQPIVINVPRTVKEVIVQARGEEYKTGLGTVLDLSRSGRYQTSLNYSPITTLDGFQVTHEPDKGLTVWRSASQIYSTFLNDSRFPDDFKIGEKSNFTYSEGTIYNSSFFYFNEDVQSEELYFRIYPLYWRENSYGESDYLMGVYFYDENDPTHIEMHDLEGFEVHDGVVLSPNDDDTWNVSTGTAAYDYTNMKKTHKVRMKGTCVTLNKSPNRKQYPYCIGFYVKSGLKEGYTEGKGRNFTHITFQNLAHNADNWKDNYWDVAIKDCKFAYSGTALHARNYNVPYIEGTTNTSSGDDVMYILGFNSQPDGISNDLGDFSDAVFLVTLKRGPVLAKPIQLKGEPNLLYPWYLAAEDLGATDDWDFNDLVVNIYDITTDLTKPYTTADFRYPTPNILGRRIIVEPRAAGGTLPLYLMYEGEIKPVPADDEPLSTLNQGFTKGTFVIGTEIHQWLGEIDYTKMLNTGLDDGHRGRAISFLVPVEKEGTPAFDPLRPSQDLGENNQTMRGFWVLVDKKNENYHELMNFELDTTPFEEGEIQNNVMYRAQSETKNVFKPFSGKLGEGMYRVDAPINGGNHTAPQMLMCHYSWQWCRERANIADAYTNFSAWVKGEKQQWHQTDATGSIGGGTNGFNPDLLCQGLPRPGWKE